VVLDVAAKTKEGEELFNEQRIYMPQSSAYGRGDKMVYSPFRKSGILADTSLQPGQTKVETFYIKFPFEEKDGKVIKVKAKEMNVEVKLWYLPNGSDPRKGVQGKNQFLFFEKTKTVTVE
jgi:exonuclease III